MGKIEDPGKDWPQILAIVVACLPGITSAFQFSWTSPFLLILMNDKEHYNISEDEANFVPVFLPIGMMLSSLFFFKIHDVIGRKYTLILLSLPHSLFWIITIFAKDVYGFYVARFIIGIADAIMYSALPIYIGEIATPRVRGTWGTGQSFSFNFGFLLINIIGMYLTIQQTAYLCITLPIISALLFPFLPESPYFYLMKGQDEKARASLQWLLRKKDIEPDFKRLKADVERQTSETGTWADLYKINSNRKALLAGIFLRLCQQLAGIIVFESYTQYIFQKSGNSLSPQISAIIFSGLLWIIMIFFTFFLDKMGRRKAMFFSILGSAIILSTEAIYFYLEEFEDVYHLNLSKIRWYPLAGLCAYLFTYCAGLGPLPSLMAGELYSAVIKGKALAVTNVASGLFLASSTFMFKSLVNSVGLYAPFMIYASSSFVGFIVSFQIIPETKGKTLEEIQQDLKGNKKLPK